MQPGAAAAQPGPAAMQPGAAATQPGPSVGVGGSSSGTGKIKRFNPRTMYGFIIPDGGGPDVYVHADVCVTEPGKPPLLEPGRLVEYDCDSSQQGNKATRVTGPGGSLLPCIAVSAVVHGTVKRFNPKTQYGFILPADGSGDVYVHAEACIHAGGPSCVGMLTEGQAVEFTTVTEKGKTKASRVTGPGGTPLSTFVSKMQAGGMMGGGMNMYGGGMMGGMMGGMGGMGGGMGGGMAGQQAMAYGAQLQARVNAAAAQQYMTQQQAGYPGQGYYAAQQAYPQQQQPQQSMGGMQGGMGGGMQGAMGVGTVKRFSATTGYGFIDAGLGGPDIYFKTDRVEPPGSMLRAGMQVRERTT